MNLEQIKQTIKNNKKITSLKLYLMFSLDEIKKYKNIFEKEEGFVEVYSKTAKVLALKFPLQNDTCIVLFKHFGIVHSHLLIFKKSFYYFYLFNKKDKHIYIYKIQLYFYKKTKTFKLNVILNVNNEDKVFFEELQYVYNKFEEIKSKLKLKSNINVVFFKNIDLSKLYNNFKHNTYVSLYYKTKKQFKHFVEKLEDCFLEKKLNKQIIFENKINIIKFYYYYFNDYIIFNVVLYINKKSKKEENKEELEKLEKLIKVSTNINTNKTNIKLIKI